MFRSTIAIAALVVAGTSFAQSFLCIADKVALMTFISKTSQIEADSGGVEQTRFIISKDERGEYEAGWFGEDSKCEATKKIHRAGLAEQAVLQSQSQRLCHLQVQLFDGVQQHIYSQGRKDG